MFGTIAAHRRRQARSADNIDDRALWMRSIDHSYRYEGYSAFRAEDLHIEGKKLEQSPFHSQSR